MHCFVTGATGFLGSHVTQGLLARGDEVTGLTSSAGNAATLENMGIEPVVGDIREPCEWVGMAVSADVVVHAAQLPLPRRPTKRYVRRTTAAQRTLLSALLPRLGSTALIYTSGTGIYGESDQPCTERYPTDPFLRSRRDVVSERLVLGAVDDHDVRATIMRPAPIYGPGGLWGRFWGRRLAAGKRPMYAGSGDQIWSFISVWDCARAYLAAIDEPTRGEIFNVADDEPVTIRTLLTAAGEAMDAPGPVGIPVPAFRLLAGPAFTGPMTSNFPASNEKLRSQFDFEPVYPTYREGVDAVADAYDGDAPAVV